ncbi:MAG TPA: potassium channel protein [Labilithrix sp.]
MHALVRRLVGAVAVLAILTIGGALAYEVLGDGRWSFADCLYMSVITISTVGYAELKQMGEVPGARTVTIGLIVSGVGALAYVQANLTALLVEGVIGHAWRRNRMQNAIAKLEGHVVVAGAGSTGKHVIEELLATGTPFVVIDRSLEHLERINVDLAGGKLLFIHGDATDDHVLTQANVAKARGVVAALTHDKDNLFVTLSARSLNDKARIVAKIVEDHAAAKMLKAGASAAVNPTLIGGRRLASELIRPEVNEFLDQMLRDKSKNLRIEEVAVPEKSTWVGSALKDTPIRRETRLLVVAVRATDRQFTYNPDPEHVLEAGTTLIVMGEAENVSKLRSLIDASGKA